MTDKTKQPSPIPIGTRVQDNSSGPVMTVVGGEGDRVICERVVSGGRRERKDLHKDAVSVQEETSGDATVVQLEVLMRNPGNTAKIGDVLRIAEESADRKIKEHQEQMDGTVDGSNVMATLQQLHDRLSNLEHKGTTPSDNTNKE